MHRRQPLPRLWLMTDERQGETLWTALERLPAGAGLVFRHYGLPAKERQRLFLRVKRIAKRKRLVLVGSDIPWRADGIHNGRSHAQRPGLAYGGGAQSPGDPLGGKARGRPAVPVAGFPHPIAPGGEDAGEAPLQLACTANAAAVDCAWRYE
jgi:hypothetical protein